MHPSLPRIGVIGAGNLAPVQALAPTGTIRHVGDVLEIAAALGYGTVLVHPNAHEPLGLPAELPADPGPHPWIADADVFPRELSHWLVGKHHGRRVDVGLVGFDTSSPLAGAPDGRELLRAAKRYQELVGVPFRWSPGRVGAELMRSVHRGPGGTCLEPPMDHVPPALEPNTEADYRWIRALDLVERAGGYVHGLDANARYLGACSSVPLGDGRMEQLDGPGFDSGQPGYWLVELRPDWTAGELPDPLDPTGRAGPGPRWMTTPTAELAHQLGAVARILTAFVYPRRHRYLAPWYERLRAARAGFLDDTTPAGQLGLALVKRTYTVALGQLASKRWDRSGDDLYRPDWRHHVIAQARVNLFRRIARVGIRPFAVDVDAVYVVHPSPEPADVGMPLGTDLGSFKSIGVAPVELVAAALDEHPGRPWPALRVALGASS